MKRSILLIAGMALANQVEAAETLAIEPACALPNYTKFTAAAGTPTRPFGVAFAAGDFNRDGRLDLMVQTVGPNTPALTPFGAKLFLQDSSGGFQEKVEYILPTVGITWEFVPADFNEDGNLDILMEEADHDMLLLLGNGDGTFREPAFLGLAAAGYFAVGDLNADGHLDIVAGKMDGTVGFFAGAGDATFALKSTLITQVSPSYPRQGGVFLGDLNRDAKTDVVVAARPGGPLEGVLEVFPGNGDGTFQDVIRTPVVAARRGALADFNGDGLLDYAGSGGPPEQLQIWLGKEDGHFAKGKVYPLSAVYTYADAVKVADVNHDGIPDLLVSGQISSTVYAGPISVFLGKGDGTFRPHIPFTQVNGARTINNGPLVLDFDGDGSLDIVSLCWTSSVLNPEALMIALSKGVRRDPTQGFTLHVRNNTSGTSEPIILETTTNLQQWTPLATNATANVSWRIVDGNAASSQRFYRTRRQ